MFHGGCLQRIGLIISVEIQNEASCLCNVIDLCDIHNAEILLAAAAASL